LCKRLAREILAGGGNGKLEVDCKKETEKNEMKGDSTKSSGKGLGPEKTWPSSLGPQMGNTYKGSNGKKSRKKQTHTKNPQKCTWDKLQ